MDAIRAESLHFHGLRHGYHHERYFEELGPVAEALLGVCFCTHCRAAADRAGVPAEEVAAAVRTELRRRLADDAAAGAPAALDELAGGAFAAYVDASAATVSSLAAELTEQARRHGMRLSFMDGAGPGRGGSPASTCPHSPRPPTRSRRSATRRPRRRSARRSPPSPCTASARRRWR
ncbi:hypothetical protein ACFQ0M_24010 [Kitasatospora aburaviensis]